MKRALARRTIASSATALALSGCGLLLDIGGGDDPPGRPDAGASVDAGHDDAGADAGDDAGADAGDVQPLDSTSCDDVHAGAILCDGFEGLPELSLWSRARGGVSYVSTPAYRGMNALRALLLPSPRIASIDIFGLPRVSEGEAFIRVYVWVPSASPVEGLTILNYEEPSEPWGKVRVRIVGGALGADGWSHDSSAALSSFGPPMPRDRWVCVEVRILVSDTAGEVELFVDGTPVAFLGPTDTAPAMPYQTLYAGITQDDYGVQTLPTELFMDELVVDTRRVGCD